MDNDQENYNAIMKINRNGDLSLPTVGHEQPCHSINHVALIG